jgi:hypothetical protein
MEGGEGYQVRDGSAPYKALFGVEKEDMELENICLWDVKTE